MAPFLPRAAHVGQKVPLPRIFPHDPPYRLPRGMGARTSETPPHRLSAGHAFSRPFAAAVLAVAHAAHLWAVRLYPSGAARTAPAGSLRADHVGYLIHRAVARWHADLYGERRGAGRG